VTGASDLKYTQTRHRMLAEIARGRCASFYGKVTWRNSEALKAADARTVDGLIESGLIQERDDHDSDAPWRAVDPTDSGRALLAAWDEKHGKVEA
jgi:hypothetical protein